ncbi:MAG: 50S ribosomal protein L11 methyltransferase, partial [Armatimonadetes bacterium]|nr:50S ribosomal protein L11 methyltransferase [Armatimonadota bacterium]
LIRVYTLAEDRSPEEVAAELQEQLGGLAVEVTPSVVRAEDWLASWREQRSVVPLIEGWAVAPPWLAAGLPAGTRAAIIDPGWAFGAGDHATTRDSAILLLRWLRPGDRVLDLGAGSGVLSILARLAGSGPVTAVEIDPIAAREIPRNAALNGVEGVEVAVGDAASIALCERYDLVLLNIGARQARLLRTRCDQVSAEGTRLIVSGLAQWSLEGVVKEYGISGWITHETVLTEQDWATVLMVREALP